MKIEEFTTSLIESIQENESGTTRRKYKSILHSFSYKRSSERIAKMIADSLAENGIITDREINSNLSTNVWITFSLQNKSEIKENSKKEEVITKPTENKSIDVPDDFFYNLFEFENNYDYERFQASLDSSSPMGLFIVPKKNDFYSSIIERVLSYEIIRKRQYNLTNEFYVGDTKQINLKNDNDSAISATDVWKSGDIHNFTEETMRDVILGVNGIDLINSKKFEEKFNQLSLYSNKYFGDQFFVLFNCPSYEVIEKHNRQYLLENVVSKVSKNLPYVFTIKCKYETEENIPKEIKEKIINHFKLLLEVPSAETETENSLIDTFVELQQTFLQSENNVLSRFEHKKFELLNYGAESDEHIYNKYFAINTLSENYKLSQIKTETTEIFEENGQKSIAKPDVIANNEIIVEVETLRGKAFDKNVYLQLVSNMIKKSKGWKKTNLKELWLVVPGFEIARNYYQLKKTSEILTSKLQNIFGSNFQCKIFVPDYKAMKIREVNFSCIYEPTNEFIKPLKPPKPNGGTQNNIEDNGFNNVVGLTEEKENLQKIIKLQEKGYGSLIKGILLYGLPGCGKTYLAKAFANESKRNFFSISPTDIVSKWIGESQQKISEIFSQVKSKSPSILFIDEIDAIAFSRDTQDTAHSDQKATINQLLIELNDIHENNDDVIVIGATNRLSALDSALKRSGRFDKKVPILPPDKTERANLFEFYISQLNKLEGINKIKKEKIDFIEIGTKSQSFTASDIKALIDDLKIKLLLEEINSLTTEILLDEIDIYKNTGQCSIDKVMVNEFAKELKLNGYNLNKIETLVNELDDGKGNIGFA